MAQYGLADPPTKAAIELVVESNPHHTDRRILKFRHLFKAGPSEHFHGLTKNGAPFKTINLDDYVEDENGKELTSQEIAFLLTGSTTAILLPKGAESHDIEYMLSSESPMPVDGIALSPDSLKIVGYFSRDWNELGRTHS